MLCPVNPGHTTVCFSLPALFRSVQMSLPGGAPPCFAILRFNADLGLYLVTGECLENGHSCSRLFLVPPGHNHNVLLSAPREGNSEPRVKVVTSSKDCRTDGQTDGREAAEAPLSHLLPTALCETKTDGSVWRKMVFWQTQVSGKRPEAGVPRPLAL